MTLNNRSLRNCWKIAEELLKNCWRDCEKDHRKSCERDCRRNCRKGCRRGCWEITEKITICRTADTVENKQCHDRKDRTLISEQFIT